MEILAFWGLQRKYKNRTKHSCGMCEALVRKVGDTLYNTWFCEATPIGCRVHEAFIRQVRVDRATIQDLIASLRGALPVTTDSLPI